MSLRTLSIIYLTVTSLTILQSCGEETPIAIDETAVKNEQYIANKEEIAFEEKMAKIDANKNLQKGNSLFYSRPDGASVDVELFIDSNNAVVKMIEHYTTATSQSLNSNVFYLDNNKKFA